MKNYYEILGINENASEEELKAAYRSLAQKYHRDNFTDNSDIELAEEKMNEINEAYDYVIQQIKSSGSNVWQNFEDVRHLLNDGKYEEALEILDGVPPQSRTAEWYYLNGIIQQNRGWFKNAYTSFSTACRLDPDNIEYRRAYEKIQHQRTSGGYDGMNTGYANDCSCCDMCACAMCSNMCCSSMRCC